jgi:Trypsin-like peptidase domain
MVRVKVYNFLFLAVLFSTFIVAQSDEVAGRRVVMIRGTLEGEATVGAGIIAGWGNERVYIFTANHVVRARKTGALAENLTVEFRDLPGELIHALPPLRDWDNERDLAMLAIESRLLPRDLLENLPPLNLGEVNALRRGDRVFAIGYKDGEPWNILSLSEFSELELDTIVFATASIDVGASGGGLYNENWELIGMVTDTQTSEARAVRIDRITELLQQWGYPINLSANTSPNQTSTCSLEDTIASQKALTLNLIEVGEVREPYTDSAKLDFEYYDSSGVFIAHLKTKGLPSGSNELRGETRESQLIASNQGCTLSLSAEANEATGLLTCTSLCKVNPTTGVCISQPGQPIELEVSAPLVCTQ